VSYDRRAVEHLLPAVWSEVAAYGIQRDDLPDPGMPKAKSNPAHSNTLYAMLADIRQAWKRAPVPFPERQALFTVYALGLTHNEAGRLIDCDRSTVTRRAERGVGRVTAWLNGDTYDDNYEAPADADVQL
jgi:DNA-directed RNA polymerase specialized sigma24 family protein